MATGGITPDVGRVSGLAVGPTEKASAQNAAINLQMTDKDLA